MSEEVKLRPEASQTTGDIQATLEQADKFLSDMAPHLGKLFGISPSISVGRIPEAGTMATNPSTGEIIVDPQFFIEHGYDAESASYGILHELSAHARTILQAPKLSKRIRQFESRGQTDAIFNNVFEDIAGNNLIHAVLPRMKHTASDLYSKKLFVETDYTALPRHMQFLYKILRQEMVPDEPVSVLPEVDEAIGSLRDYQGEGDLIKYSTSVAKSSKEAMTADERFKIWTSIVHPVYEKLLEQDRGDKQRQKSEDDQSDNQNQENQQNLNQESTPPENQTPETAPSEQDRLSEQEDQNPEGSSESASNTEDQTQSDQQSQEQSSDSSGQSSQNQSDEQRFGYYYADYEKNRHPGSMNEEDEQKLQEFAQEELKTNHSNLDEHEAMLDKKLRQETGHGLQEQRHYNVEVLKWQSTIEDMRQVFQTVINERIGLKRGLTRRTLPEGAILDPDHLSQTIIDMRTGTNEPEIFRDYEKKKGEIQSFGKTDYVFLFDVSGSMRQGQKSEAACASAVIGLEGLAAMQRDIEEAEASVNMDLELDIRTAIYTFGDHTDCLKPLSTHIKPKERLDAYDALSFPNGNSTYDFLGLEEINQIPTDDDRRQILIVVSDGQSSDSSRARRAIDTLRGKGWFVYGISIGSDAAEHLYRPTAKRVDNPQKLPETIQKFIETTIV